MDAIERMKKQIVDFARGNIGALTVLGRLTNDDLDGIAAFHVIEYLPKLRGDKIWELFKNTHNHDLSKMKADLISRGARLTQKLDGTWYIPD